MSIFHEVAVVGMHFRGVRAQQIVSALSEGDLLTLDREPENPYDANAIRVLYAEEHIGYIARESAVWIAPELDEGGTATCTVDRLELRKKNLHPICQIEVAG
jgi:hypothetical protein